MTTPSSPESAVKGLRPLFAWALLGYVALHLVFEFFSWLVPSRHDSFTMRSYYADFVGLYTIALPLLALLIAVQITPVLGASKIMAAIALAEYAFALFFGVVTFLIGLGYAFTFAETSAATAFGGLRHLVMSVAELALLALAAYASLRVFTSLGGKLPDLTTAVRQQAPPAQPQPPTQQQPPTQPPAAPTEPPGAHRAP
ncbi:MAG: hypothetical protein HOV79_28340 [Hamadaea sp.]|nr:hypothetical protein [Hamadaea sp.]